MLDVLHVILEDDSTAASTEEQAKAKKSARETIFSSLYANEYSGSFSNVEDTLPTDGYEGDEDIDPFNPNKPEVKPYFPPTAVDADYELPFGRALDKPF